MSVTNQTLKLLGYQWLTTTPRLNIIILSRFILNLLELEPSEQSTPGSFSHIQFATSVLGNIGAPLSSANEVAADWESEAQPAVLRIPMKQFVENPLAAGLLDGGNIGETIQFVVPIKWLLLDRILICSTDLPTMRLIPVLRRKFTSVLIRPSKLVVELHVR